MVCDVACSAVRGCVRTPNCDVAFTCMITVRFSLISLTLFARVVLYDNDCSHVTVSTVIQIHTDTIYLLSPLHISEIIDIYRVGCVGHESRQHTPGQLFIFLKEYKYRVRLRRSARLVVCRGE